MVVLVVCFAGNSGVGFGCKVAVTIVVPIVG